jgi:predicted ATPase/signal transduction histidine kinase/tRNA A-37 threonylcarbamoyl transferase component Bud32
MKTNFFQNYTMTEILQDGVNTVIYKAQRKADSTPVIIKILKAEFPTLVEVSRLRHEYKIRENLNIEGIVKAYQLETYQNSFALILEDFGGKSLKQFLADKTIDLETFLRWAIQLTIALGELHKHHIIHKDIKPSNIIINPLTEQIKITDFSISSQLSRESSNLNNLQLLEGTLSYISPEQTGRMNRSIDYRTDFYSLGITFYEILTKVLPFQATDPLELLHAHIALKPVPPHQHRSEIPKIVSDIVMKLMAKTAEDRYQSAEGLKADLEICLSQLQTSGKIENFPIGQLDKSGQFLIPQKLYGRESEVTLLMDAFQRVAAGSSEITLVSGYSGIGKTSVVYEVHKPIVAARGYFITGKFDQLKRNIPYAALIQAFTDLMGQLLTESSTKLAVWKEQLLAALGQNAQVMIDVIPELELIIGQQPAVPKLGPAESQNRFNRVFHQFIAVFTQPAHPLVIFLDDLQWADSASLKLIELLMGDVNSQYLLMIGAYRDNEVSATHPLVSTIETLKEVGVSIHEIVLQPLHQPHVFQLISETLNEPTETFSRLNDFAELIFHKTQGNPFFLTQVLQTLYSDQLLSFDYLEGRWLWDLEKIQAVGITDYNVIQLISRNIQKLSNQTIEILKLAACIGNKFNLDVLAIVSETSLLTTADILWEALQIGLILPMSNDYKIPLVFEQESAEVFDFNSQRISYKFLHDRVQQAAYSLIPEEQKKATHLKIGRRLFSKSNQYTLEDNIFDILNQLNIGVEFIDEPAEKTQLAELNLLGGRKAKAASAYDAALKYLRVGLNLLAPDSWTQQYDLTFSLYLEAIEAEYLNTHFEAAATLAEIALKQAGILLDQVKVYEAKIQLDIAQWQMLRAIETGLQVLETLGVSLASLTQEDSLMVELPALSELETIPEMTDLNKRAALQILKTICAPIFMAKPEIFPAVILTMIKLCLKYGNCDLSAFAYGFYGLLLAGMGQIEQGYHAGQIALRLLEQFDAKALKAKVYNLFNANIRSWKEPAKNSVPAFSEGLQSGLETGDLEWASYCGANYCSYVFWTEDNLETVVEKQAPYLKVLQTTKLETALQFGNIYRQTALNLMGVTKEATHLVGENFDETVTLPLLIESKSGTGLFIFHVSKLILFYLFNDYESALKHAELASEQAGSAFGFIQMAIHNFYESLALLGHYHQVSETEQETFLKKVEANQEKLKHWANHAPTNFQHKYDLVAAEIARVCHQKFAAMEFYDQAIAGARNSGYFQEEALANERAAEFYFAGNREKIAQAYLIDAYYGYIRWGAKAKVKDLEARYPVLFHRLLAKESTEIDVNQTTTSTTGEITAALDLAAVMKASQAISSEIILDHLLKRLIQITVESAGATKGMLFLLQNETLKLATEAVVEKDNVIVLASTPVDNRPDLPVSVIDYVERTKKTLVLNDATKDGYFINDSYILRTEPKSVLCMPLVHKNQFTGIVYLENNLTVAAFTPQRIKVLKLLASQAAISIENAHLYRDLRTYSRELTIKNTALEASEHREREKAEQLAKSLQELQQTQAQLVQTEKISSLGQLVAGVAHEVNNPVSFINGNLHLATEYAETLLNVLSLYEKYFPNPPKEIQETVEAVELDFLKEDLPKMIASMKVGTDRIRDIMQSLRNFSRIDSAEKKSSDLHAGLDSTLMILQHRFKGKGSRKVVHLVKEYGDLPLVECYAGQLNQVFMNLLANALDAMEEQRQSEEKEIQIRTEVIHCPESRVLIRIRDNGPGISEEVKQRLFEPFFTTKPIGKGTGLGLSISHQIVVEKHGGQIECISTLGAGTEFVISIPIRQTHQNHVHNFQSA